MVATQEQPWQKKAREYMEKEKAKADSKSKELNLKLAQKIIEKATPALTSWEKLNDRPEMEMIGVQLKAPLVEGISEFTNLVVLANQALANEGKCDGVLPELKEVVLRIGKVKRIVAIVTGFIAMINKSRQ